MILIGLVGGIAFWRWAYHDLPEVPTTAQELWSVRREAAVTVLAENGAVLGQRGPLYARPVRLDDLPDHVPQAFLAVEDRRFYEHDGFDERGFARAMWANVRAGGLVPMLAEPVDTLMPDVEGLRDLGDTNGDRLLHVGLGAAGRFCEADGACYELTGEGTAQPANELVLQGNTAHQGDGWRLVTTGQPSGRQIRVIAH